MANHGYSYITPLAVVADIDMTSSDIPLLEIKTALADVDCKAATNVVGIWYAVECAHENAMIEQVRSKLDAVQARTAAILNSAESILLP